ncbi:hypothetical protein P3X46_024850 [Hevea brasiliensis]|uniref:F-box domain-containing protein n=1 Tax=Hevea brasiliensis TaxID=3981 RepID=A0ABQ9L3S9_HEVBR|nr:F-box protein At2g26160 [Hevea brasiliensis]KAJ9159340.1 hypothetical protein P3X46_024850 [Hevea brasiliensis]
MDLRSKSLTILNNQYEPAIGNRPFYCFYSSLFSTSATMEEHSGTSSKRLRLSFIEDSFAVKPNWSDLQPELLELIISKLSFINIIRLKAVCSSWRSFAESYVSFLPRTPWLLLPGNQEHHARCFFSLEDNKVYQIKNISNLFGDDAWCVGSSHGWLVLLDDEAKPFLLNPFSQVRIQLPTIERFVFLVHKSYFIKVLRKGFITRAILSSDPSHDNNYVVVLILGYVSRLAFYKKGVSGWTISNGASRKYCDIIYCNDLFYALTLDNSIEVWDFHASLPIKNREIHPSVPRKIMEATECLRSPHCCQSHLVESSGDLLLVLRYLGKEGKLWVCPYRTQNFHVYRLDSNDPNWVEVDNLKNEVLFLAGNHSMSLSAQDFSGFEKNSIYFTGDIWNQMNKDYSYAGYDLGKFSLEEKITKPFYAFGLGRTGSPSFWIVPNP